MGSFSPMHWMIVALVVLALFGGGRVSGLMGGLARGIKFFRGTMAEDTPTASPALLTQGVATHDAMEAGRAAV